MAIIFKVKQLKRLRNKMITKCFMAAMLLILIVPAVFISCTKENSTLISEIQTHILLPGESHAGLWLGPGLFCTPSEQPKNFHIFFTETDRTGGDAATKKHYFTAKSFPDEKELVDDWWKEWKEQPYPEELRARIDEAGYEWTPTFNWKYHRRSGNWLGIGHLLRHKNKRLDNHVEHLAITYSVFNAAAKSFSAWKSFRIKIDGVEKPCVAYGQRVDLENGDILLPFSAIKEFTGGNSLRWCGAAFCTFDGTDLKVRKISELFTNPVPRGFGEPSMTFYKDRYFMTLRAQDGFGYVVTSRDGLDWSEPRPWSWDDGTPIPMNQTMTKFLTHSEGLYLVYTRITEDNENVFRNRAPLFMAQLDVDKTCLIRDSEHIIFQNKGLPIGNFNIHAVSPLESWVTVPEWDRSGRDISCDVLLGRIMWSKKNNNVGE